MCLGYIPNMIEALAKNPGLIGPNPQLRDADIHVLLQQQHVGLHGLHR